MNLKEYYKERLIASLITEGEKSGKPKPKVTVEKKPIVDWSKYDKWKSGLSPAAAAKENKRIADAHKLFKLSRSEKEYWKGIESRHDSTRDPSPGSRWI